MLLLLLLCCLCFVFEIRAGESSVETVYRLKSGSVCLEAGGKPPYEHSKWSHGDKRIASDHSINPDYKKHTVFYRSNATLCIINLTKKDSGFYTFSYEKNFTNVNKRYQVFVQDPVPKPILILTLDQVNVSLGLCNFTVNCSVSSVFLWTHCDQDGCQTLTKSSSQLNITVTAGNRRVTCTGNNRVSSQEESQDLEDMCFAVEHQELQKSDHPPYIQIFVATLLSAVLFIFVFSAALRVISRRNNTPPQVIPSQPLEQELRVSTSSTLTQASYENVDPVNSDQNNQTNENSDTVYCVLEPIPASASRQGHEESLEDSNEIHTVYSVIRTPEV